MGFGRIIVTGARGMLGRDLIPYLKAKGYDVIGTHSDYLSLLQTEEEIQQKLAVLNPGIIIHAAAYTNVERAETDADLAMMVNRDGTHKVAMAAKSLGAIMAYISTDYVFDGAKGSPYTVQDRPNPLGVYGRSKYYGELAVGKLLDTSYIIRTSWLYGVHGWNFIQYIIDAGQQGREISAISDQIGSPTWTGSLCLLIEKIITSGAYGIYHAADQGIISRYHQALTVCQYAGLSSHFVRPITTEELALKAPRPRYSALDPAPLPASSWETALQCYLRQRDEQINKPENRLNAVHPSSSSLFTERLP